MIVLCTDLDNTLIYSYKHDIGPHKRGAEWYRGREISFLTERTYELLRELKRHMLIVPTSTRTVEQYSRIHLGIGAFRYALTCNGGVLLLDGCKDERWYRESLELAGDSRDVMDEALRVLEHDARRSFELRFIEELFVFTKCEQPEAVAADLKKRLDMRSVDVLLNGAKLYVIPKYLSKGMALKRLKSRLKDSFFLAAGDSAFDISMLREADVGFAPYGFQKNYGIDFAVEEAGKGALFSEAFPERALQIFASMGGKTE